MSSPTIHGMLESIYQMLTPSEMAPLIGGVSSAVKGVVAIAQMVARLAILLISTPLSMS